HKQRILKIMLQLHAFNGILYLCGKLLLLLDADRSTKVDDLAKLENQILAVAKMKHGE
nr:dolichyl-phosphate beta-glucosyltransferase-like [Tanacetum cinerariifolium]